uniref:DUF6824 domain-containing protein n=1 Tax=Grammatophora oceanica TaxID=210454 RepID=A0A7S1UR29_9STRA|mmetsp:Transcript_17817/g.26366  ORF Transcript_17817/g.26366 Transcript_17817/m.26366 type:complete len:294 (+) Transcript_17817:492-1373(+)
MKKDDGAGAKLIRFGRNPRHYNSPANRYLRSLVEDHVFVYDGCTRAERSLLLKGLLQHLRRNNFSFVRRGRKKKKKGEEEDEPWQAVPDREATGKISHLFRDISLLRRNQKEEGANLKHNPQGTKRGNDGACTARLAAPIKLDAVLAMLRRGQPLSQHQQAILPPPEEEEEDVGEWPSSSNTLAETGANAVRQQWTIRDGNVPLLFDKIFPCSKHHDQDCDVWSCCDYHDNDNTEEPSHYQSSLLPSSYETETGQMLSDGENKLLLSEPLLDFGCGQKQETIGQASSSLRLYH